MPGRIPESSPAPPPPARPDADATGDRRLVSLDVIRGLAIFGILVVHATYMGQLRPLGGGGWQDAVGRALVSGLFELKFWAVFSMLFGAGFLLQAVKADRKGRPFGARFLRRMAVLTLFGLLHGVFLFPADVLFLYGVVGLILYPLRRCPARVLAILGVLLTLVPAGLSLAGDWTPTRSPSLDPGPPVTALSFEELIDHAEAEDEGWARILAVARGQGPYWFTVKARAAEFVLWLALCGLFFFWRVVGLFFLGAALMKWRFFHHDGVILQRRLLGLGLRIGLPLELAYGVANGIWSLDTGGSPAFQAAFAVHVLGSVLLALGIMAGLVGAVHSGRAARTFHALAAVGRMALTCYVGQSLFACLVMDWYGLGWFNRFGPLVLLAAVPVVFALQSLGCVVWMRFFRMGPLEWLWRTATYLRRQPLRV